MEIKDAIYKRRTIRKFRQQPISREILTGLIDCGRMSASAANMQPIKYAVIDSPKLLADIFPLTKWAGAEPAAGPGENERPAAYIAVIGDNNINPGSHQNEAGLVMSTICLAAVGEGLGSCILGAIDRKKINALLELPNNLHTLYLIALGYPSQESRAVDIKDGSCKYYFENGCLCVPKRTAEEVIIF